MYLYIYITHTHTYIYTVYTCIERERERERDPHGNPFVCWLNPICALRQELLPGLSDDSTTCSRRGPSLVSTRAVVGVIPGALGRWQKRNVTQFSSVSSGIWLFEMRISWEIPWNSRMFSSMRLISEWFLFFRCIAGWTRILSRFGIRWASYPTRNFTFGDLLKAPRMVYRFLSFLVMLKYLWPIPCVES